VVSPDRIGIAHRQAGDVNQRQPMMLVVIRQKAQSLVTKNDPRREYGLIPLDHLFELPGSQHEMSELGRANRLGDGA